MNSNDIWRRRFSKLTVFSVLFLIFAGGMVTSTGSGLSVPDWPLSYGMIFPPMVGGVFYEHGHRMVASVVGFFTLTLAIWMGRTEPRKWVRNLSYGALGAVITQGLLGGLTVLFFLPKPISISHAVLAQTFFTLTIIIAYSQSQERAIRETQEETSPHPLVAKMSLIVVGIIYCQLILGAAMRHTFSGLAIPDFPTMGWQFLPSFDAKMLATINSWRFDHNLPAVVMAQVWIHLAHRFGALLVVLSVVALNIFAVQFVREQKKIWRTVLLLDLLIGLQVTLGILTIWTGKAPVITSLHVVIGAASLGMSVLLALRVLPTRLRKGNLTVVASGVVGTGRDLSLSR